MRARIYSPRAKSSSVDSHIGQPCRRRHADERIQMTRLSRSPSEIGSACGVTWCAHGEVRACASFLVPTPRWRGMAWLGRGIGVHRIGSSVGGSAECITAPR